MPAAAPACGVLDLSCHVAGAVDSWFTSLVTSAVSPLFALIGRTHCPAHLDVSIKHTSRFVLPSLQMPCKPRYGEGRLTSGSGSSGDRGGSVLSHRVRGDACVGRSPVVAWGGALLPGHAVLRARLLGGLAVTQHSARSSRRLIGLWALLSTDTSSAVCVERSDVRGPHSHPTVSRLFFGRNAPEEVSCD
jgi:hypothetical protein